MAAAHDRESRPRERPPQPWAWRGAGRAGTSGEVDLDVQLRLVGHVGHAGLCRREVGALLRPRGACHARVDDHACDQTVVRKRMENLGSTRINVSTNVSRKGQGRGSPEA